MAKHFCEKGWCKCSFCCVKIDDEHYECQWGLDDDGACYNTASKLEYDWQTGKNLESREPTLEEALEFINMDL